MEKHGQKYFKLEVSGKHSNLKPKLRVISGFRKIGLNYFYLPYTDANVDFLVANKFEFNGAFTALQKAEYKKQNPIEAIPKYDKLGVNLYKYQIEGVNFIEYHKGRAIIADEMGLGKTVQALGWIQYRKDIKKFLIICPSSLKINWQEEAERWITRKLKAQILEGTTPYEITGDIVVINYDILSNWIVELKLTNFDACIADEIHYVKNHASKRAKAFIEITKGIQNLIGLTGTPIENDPMEIYYLVNLVNKNIFPNYIKFITRYCDAKQVNQMVRGGSIKKLWKRGDFINQGELHRILKKYVMIRRTKEEVDLQLPPKTYSNIDLRIDNWSEYREAEEDFIRYIKENYTAKRLADELEGLEDESENLNDKLDAISRAPALAKIQALKLIAANGKMRQVIDWIKDFLETDEKLIVFAINKVIVKTLMDAFPLAVKIDGSTSKVKRDEAVKSFQNDPKCKLFIGNIKAAGVGLTLTAASKVAIVQFPWNPGELLQAEDRCVLKDELIITKTGFIKIQDIKVGDTVLSHKGNWCKVTDTFTHLERKKSFVDITYKGFWKPLKVTDDHLIYVWNKETDKYEWVEAGKLHVFNHYLVFSTNLSESKLELVSSKNTVSKTFTNNFGSIQPNSRRKSLPRTVALSVNLMYAFGRYLADGWSVTGDGKGNSVNICDSSDKEKAVYKCAATICDAFKIHEFSKYKRENVSTAIINSKNLANLFIKWFGKDAFSKKIPNFVFTVNDEFKKAFLNGYYDGDGYVRKNTQQATTVSEKIAIGLSILESHLGNPITLRYNEKASTYSFEYLDRNKCVKETQIKNKDGNTLFPISEIRKYKPRKNYERVYDLSVETDNSFHVGYSSVHNCHRITQKEKVTIYKFVAKNTIEERIVQLLKNKQIEIDKIIDGAPTSIKTDLVKLLINTYK